MAKPVQVAIVRPEKSLGASIAALGTPFLRALMLMLTLPVLHLHPSYFQSLVLALVASMFLRPDHYMEWTHGGKS